jgi:xylulokinase
LGSTNFRAALLDREGRIVCGHVAAAGGADGPADEVDPGHWWRLFTEAAEALAAQSGPAFRQVAGIAVCGITRTQVFLDADGDVLRPALTWRDTRAVSSAARLAAWAPDEWPEKDHLNAFHPAARLLWLAETEPAQFARLHAVVDPKDYLNFRLTGVLATDVVSGARLWAASRPWPGGGLFAAAGLPASLIAIPFLDPRARLGTVQSGLPGVFAALAGQPVFAMANDTWATAAGMGALRPGVAYNISGTTEVFGAIAAEAATAPGLMSVDWGAGLQQLGGPSQSGADTVAWLMPLLTGDGAAIERLLAAPRQPEPALFLPFLSGERVPYWEPLLRAAWLGLNRRHGATDLAHAVLEGVAFLNRLTLERAEAATNDPVREIRFGGGGAANPVWCQIKADVTGRTVLVGEAAEPGLLGCAVVAWTGLGAFGDLDAAQRHLVRIAHRYAADPARHAAYGALYALWLDAVAATRPISARLAALSMPTPIAPRPCPP